LPWLQNKLWLALYHKIDFILSNPNIPSFHYSSPFIRDLSYRNKYKYDSISNGYNSLLHVSPHLLSFNLTGFKQIIKIYPTY